MRPRSVRAALLPIVVAGVLGGPAVASAQSGCGGLLQPPCPAPAPAPTPEPAPTPAPAPSPTPAPAEPVVEPRALTAREYREIDRAVKSSLPLDARSTSRRRQAYRRACARMAQGAGLLRTYRKVCLADSRIYQLSVRQCRRNDQCATYAGSIGRSLERWAAEHRKLDKLVAARVAPDRCRAALRSGTGVLKGAESIARGYYEIEYGIRDYNRALFNQGVRRIERTQRRVKFPSNRARLKAFRAGCRP